MAGWDFWCWDYDGDDFDQGEDCYFAGITGTLLEADGDVYTIRAFDPFSGETEDAEVRITVDGDTLRTVDISDGFEAIFSETTLINLILNNNFKNLVILH